MNTRTEILKFRVTPEEKEIITHKALSSYRLVSQYLRDCALEKEITVINGADTVADELRRIGNNVNQIARAVNAGFVTEAISVSGVNYIIIHFIVRDWACFITHFL